MATGRTTVKGSALRRGGCRSGGKPPGQHQLCATPSADRLQRAARLIEAMEQAASSVAPMQWASAKCWHRKRGRMKQMKSTVTVVAAFAFSGGVGTSLPARSRFRAYTRDLQSLAGSFTQEVRERRPRQPAIVRQFCVAARQVPFVLKSPTGRPSSARHHGLAVRRKT